MNRTAVFLVFFVSVLFCKPKSPERESISTAYVYQVTGQVTIHDSKGSPVAEVFQRRLEDGDRIRTGARSQVEILLATGGSLRLFDQSELVVDTKFFRERDQARNRFQILLGKVFVSQPVPLKKTERLEVFSTTQIGGVRGTEFLVVADQDQSQILVGEGQVQTERIETLDTIPEIMDTSPTTSQGNKSVATKTKRETEPLTLQELSSLQDLKLGAQRIQEEAKEQIQSMREQFQEEKNRIKADAEKFREENKAKSELEAIKKGN